MKLLIFDNNKKLSAQDSWVFAKVYFFASVDAYVQLKIEAMLFHLEKHLA